MGSWSAKDRPKLRNSLCENTEMGGDNEEATIKELSNSQLASLSPKYTKNVNNPNNTFVSQKFSLQNDIRDNEVLRLNNSFM